jgi:hypothetical protein
MEVIMRSIGVCVLPLNSNVNTEPIIIRSGTIQNFNVGVNVGPAISGGPLSGQFSAIQIEKIVFLNLGEGVAFSNTNSSTISDCIFTNVGTGIGDYQSQGGNKYINDVFNGFISGPLAGTSFYGILETGNTPYTVEHCHFEALAN